MDDIECQVMHIDRREDDTITIRLKAPPHESGAASVKVYLFSQDPLSESWPVAVGSIMYVAV